MRWTTVVAYFFGGAFLVNAIPHFVSGVSGHPFPSPFSSPPGQGLSSPTVNVWWGALNLLVAYLLLCRVGRFEARRIAHVAPAAIGGLLIAVLSAHAFGRVFGGS
jgi:hypothetical protein